MKSTSKGAHTQSSTKTVATSYAGSSTGDKGKTSSQGNPRTKCAGDTHK